MIEEFLPIDLGGNDVVLGIQWLATMGTMTVDWKLLTMKFHIGAGSDVVAGRRKLG